MRILRLCTYFYPEVNAASHLMDDIYEKIASEKYECVCITPEPSRGISKEVRAEYKKRKNEKLYDGYITVKRFSMISEGTNPLQKTLKYVLSCIKTYFTAIKETGADVVFSSSTPPIMGLIAGRAAKKLSKKYGKKVPFVYNLQDVFPDSLVTSGFAKKGGFLWKIGRVIENKTYAYADRIIVISESMKRNIIEKGVSEEKITVVSNWIDEEAVKPVKKEDNTLYEEFNIDREKFTVLYAGNFGAAQGAEVVLESALRLKDNTDIQFVIFGGGAGFESAKRRVEEQGLCNVIINPLLPAERVPEVYSLGDVALITCKKGVGNSGMPSKTWSIMACNTPIIASFDLKSELAEIIANSKTGVCVEPENEEALTKAILSAFSGELVGENGRDYILKNASKKLCTQKYADELSGAVKNAAK